MCVYSMIMDHYHDKWKFYPEQAPKRIPTQEEIDEFYKLLERAREYDKKNNEPDCELESKKQKLKDLANEMGVEIHFD